jgi:hypothetical protein
MRLGLPMIRASIRNNETQGRGGSQDEVEMQGERGRMGRKRDGGRRGRTSARKGEISKTVQYERTNYVPGTKKRSEMLKWECVTRAKLWVMQ